MFAFLFYIYIAPKLPLELSGIDVIVKILTIIISGIDIVVVRTIFDIILKRFFKIYNQKVESRKELQNKCISKHRLLKYDLSWYFGDYPEISKIFMPVKCILSQNTKKINKNKYLNLWQSTLLEGEAGSGKSTYLKKSFLYYNSFLWRIFYKLTRKCILFFDADEFLLSIQDEDLLKKVKDSKFRKISIIIDGIDELGEDEKIISKVIGYLFKLVNDQYNGKCNLIVSCRTSSSWRYTNDPKFLRLISQKYSIQSWTTEDICLLVKEIEKHLSKRNDIDVNDLRDKLCDPTTIAKIVKHNPLRCKIYCIVMSLITLKDDNTDYSNDYLLYEIFFEHLIKEALKRYYPRIKNLSDLSKTEMLNIGELALIKYKSRVYHNNFSNKIVQKVAQKTDNRILPLVYEEKNNNFWHRTYEEFFVSYYYVSEMKRKDENIIKIIDVLTCSYTNPYSDFINKAFQTILITSDQRKSLISYYTYIYYFSISPLKNKELNQQYKFTFLKDYKTFQKQYTENREIINKLERNQLLYLKYEITFRVGRLFDDAAKQFLIFVYKYDVLSNYPKKYKYSEFESVILKRQCAISSSFLCQSSLEIDYVKKTLNYLKSEYSETYDLVNRSHTQIYYGDVKETDILTYRDNGYGEWKKAREKRINRLKEIPNCYCPEDKITCFRLFDLATIYSFLQSRKYEKLSETEIKIIKETKLSDILNNPYERESLMIEIQQHIIQLL